MSDTYEPVTPEGVEQKPAASVEVFDSEAALQQLPPGPERRAVFGEVEPSEPVSIEEAVKQLRNRRGEQPREGVDFKVDGRTAKEQTDRQGARDLTFAKRVDHVGRIMQALPGVDVETAGATAVTAEKGGHIHEYKLDKKDRADPLSHGDSPEEAQQRLTALREQRAADLHALTEQLSQPVEQQQQPAEAPPVEPQQQPPEQPPPVVDPIESERQRVQQEAATLAALRNMSAKEIQLTVEAEQHVGEAHRLNAFITQKHGSKVQQAGSLEALGKIDPGAVNEILQAQAAYNQRMEQAGARIAESQHYQQLRASNEALLQNTRAAELARVNRVEGEKAATEFTKYVEARDPQWKSDPDYRQSLQKMAVDIVEEVSPGSSAAIQRGEMYVTAGQQKALYDVARARLGDERIKASMESGRRAAMDDLPKVMRPGNGETRAEAAAHDFGARLRALPGIPSTEDAMREGARLLKARRGAR